LIAGHLLNALTEVKHRINDALAEASRGCIVCRANSVLQRTSSACTVRSTAVQVCNAIAETMAFSNPSHQAASWMFAPLQPRCSVSETREVIISLRCGTEGRQCIPAW
jgi:hypothetical protein